MHAITGEASGELVLRTDSPSTLPDGDRRAELSISFWSDIGTKYVQSRRAFVIAFVNFNSYFHFFFLGHDG